MSARGTPPRGTILFVHGAFCGGWCFDSFAPRFAAEGWQTLAPDLPHHDADSRSRPSDRLGRVSLAAYRADLETRIRALPEPPLIVGHSMGGLLAQQLAARGLARALILLAPSPPWGIFPATVGEMHNATGLLRAGAFWHKALHPDFETAAANSLDRLTPEQQRAAFARLGPESGRALFEILYWMFDLHHTSAVDHRKVRCPVLIAVGSDDKVVSPETARSIRHRYRRVAELRVIPGMSHFIFGEPAEDRLTELCLGWLDRQSA